MIREYDIEIEILPDGGYSAIDKNTYDGAPDSTTNFVGYGQTEEDAIEDLKIAIASAEPAPSPLTADGVCECGHAHLDNTGTRCLVCKSSGCYCKQFKQKPE